MELRGIGTTRRRRTVGAIPPTRREYRVERSVSIDPTVGSRSNFVSQDSGGYFRWSSVESVRPSTASGRGHFTDRTRTPGQKVFISRSDRWIALKLFFTSFRRLFSME